MEVILIAAQSVDGFITRHDEPGSGFASAEDRTYFQEAMEGFDSCIMGSVTYRVARAMILGKLAPGRSRVVMTREPAKYAGDFVPGLLEFTDEAPAALIGRLSREGHRRCALLGGSRVHSLFLEARLVNEIWLTVEPRLFGAGVPLLHSAADIHLKLLSHGKLEGSDTLLIKFALQ
jgi:dihydrofolate reductase